MHVRKFSAEVDDEKLALSANDQEDTVLSSEAERPVLVVGVSKKAKCPFVGRALA